VAAARIQVIIIIIIIITSTKEVMFSEALVCLFVSRINPDHVTLGLELRLGEGTAILRRAGCVNLRPFNIATSAALADKK